ncbi:PREDICTED: protein AATF-like [Rhagoletis zephyria]|uniref:protein AATF-like n=1 Tax=Rhagoletis zephyria TaxID=28612 RepID=UPI00081147D3|nr:PREDICTED: protein AATF-like [Rhagoletis zephyria]
MNNRNLSHELQNLINPEPTFEDPEDGENIDSSDKWFNSRPAAENDDDEVQAPVVSKIRKKQVSFLSSIDKRYVGKKISRTNLASDDEESESISENVNSDSDDSSREGELDDSKVDDEEEDDEEGLSESDFDEEDQMSDDELGDSDQLPKPSNGVSHDDDDDNFNILNFDASKQMSKASAVKNQLLIYDNLLEARIKMQKLLLSTNRLPQHQNLSAVKSAKSALLTELINECAKGTRKLGKLLLELDTFLDMNNEEDKAEQTASKPERKRPKSTDFEESTLSKRFCKLASQYRPVIEDWHERTKFVNANAKLKKFESFDVCPTKSIDQILTNKERLISRTRVKRSAIKIIGQSENSEAPEDDPNSSLVLDTYDDDDFYHQLLRQIIENKMGNVDDSTAMSKKYMEIQRMRNKLKKQVDTRASKGRKIRYDVHEKLVNFMAPVDRTSMTDEAKSELFKSLFGNFSANVDD